MRAPVTGFIDRRPTWVRDLTFMLIACLLMWASTYLAPVLAAAGGLWASLAAPLVVLLVGVLTQWTQAYGRGSGRHAAGTTDGNDPTGTGTT